MLLIKHKRCKERVFKTDALQPLVIHGSVIETRRAYINPSTPGRLSTLPTQSGVCLGVGTCGERSRDPGSQCVKAGQGLVELLA